MRVVLEKKVVAKFLLIFLIISVAFLSFLRSFLGLIGVVPWHVGYSDIFNQDRIDTKEAFRIPYLEQSVEYPVLTGFFIYFSWLIGRNILGYAIASWMLLTLFTIISFFALYKLADIIGVNKNRILWFFILSPSLLVFDIYNWDMMAVMLMTLSIYFFYRENHLMSGFFLSLGFNAKIFAILLLPIFLLKARLRDSFKIASAFIFTFLALNFYFIINSFDVWKVTYTFHAMRAPNIDSIWSLTGLNTGTINILSLLLFSAAYAYFMIRHKKYDFLTLSFIAVLLFLLFNKIFSPQYIMWLLPFFVLIENIPKSIFYYLEVSNLLVFFSTLSFLLNSPDKLFLIISRISVVARSLIVAFMIYNTYRWKVL